MEDGNDEGIVPPWSRRTNEHGVAYWYIATTSLSSWSPSPPPPPSPHTQLPPSPPVVVHLLTMILPSPRLPPMPTRFATTTTTNPAPQDIHYTGPLDVGYMLHSNWNSLEQALISLWKSAGMQKSDMCYTSNETFSDVEATTLFGHARRNDEGKAFKRGQVYCKQISQGCSFCVPFSYLKKPGYYRIQEVERKLGVHI